MTKGWSVNFSILTLLVYFRLVRDQDVHFFYTRFHLSALQSCANIFSTNFQFTFTFKECTTQFSPWIVLCTFNNFLYSYLINLHTVLYLLDYWLLSKMWNFIFIDQENCQYLWFFKILSVNRIDFCDFFVYKNVLEIYMICCI